MSTQRDLEYLQNKITILKNELDNVEKEIIMLQSNVVSVLPISVSKGFFVLQNQECHKKFLYWGLADPASCRYHCSG